MKIFKSKLSIAFIFFVLGFFTHLYLVNKNISEDRVQVTPEEFDRLHESSGAQDVFGVIDEKHFDIGPTKREDNEYVYYEFSFDKKLKNEYKINIKDGHIHLKIESSESGFHSSSEQVFPIDSSLDDRKAEVINEENKIIIKIPKL